MKAQKIEPQTSEQSRHKETEKLEAQDLDYIQGGFVIANGGGLGDKVFQRPQLAKQFNP